MRALCRAAAAAVFLCSHALAADAAEPRILHPPAPADFDLLDMTGGARIATVQDMTAPPGYGPEVLHIDGGHVIALAKGLRAGAGVLTTLYRELDPRDRDADGILVFHAAYGDDVSLEHNTKLVRPHAWLELDNDYGLHFRYVPDDNAPDRAFAGRPGHRLVTDPWNVTGWIWQKVRFDGERVQAKVWPAHKPEPEAWDLNHKIHKPPADGAASPIAPDYFFRPPDEPGRVGFRAYHGNIHIAYLAYAPEDAWIPPPPYYVHVLPGRTLAEDAHEVALFLNVSRAELAGARLTLETEDEVVRDEPVPKEVYEAALRAKAEPRDVPGNGSLVLEIEGETPRDEAPPELDTPMPGDAFRFWVVRSGPPPEGVLTLRTPRRLRDATVRIGLRAADGELLTARTLDLAGAAELHQRFAAIERALEAVRAHIVRPYGSGDDTEITPFTPRLEPEHPPEAFVARDAAIAHFDVAAEARREGRHREVERALGYAAEAMQELLGWKGIGLRQDFRDELATLPRYTLPLSGETAPIMAYPRDYRIEPVLDDDWRTRVARSLVMGGTGVFRVSLRALHARPSRDYAFRLLLVSPRGDRIVAEADAEPGAGNRPASEWEPGTIQQLHFRFSIPSDNLHLHQPRPTVLDEWHWLLLEAIDPATGARLLLDAHPGSYPDIPQGRYPIGQVYVSSHPYAMGHHRPRPAEPDPPRVEWSEEGKPIDRMAPPVAGVPQRHAVGVLLTGDLPDWPLADLVYTIRPGGPLPSSPQGEVVYRAIEQTIATPNFEQIAEFLWTPRQTGPMIAEARLYQEGVLLTKSRMYFEVLPPEGAGEVRIGKPLHTTISPEGEFQTRIRVGHGGFMGPVKARVASAGELLLETTYDARYGGSVTLRVPPRFGYYDLVFEFGGREHHERIAAATQGRQDGFPLLNGEPFIVKGLNVHGLDGASPVRTRAMMRIFRERGFNMLRGDFPPRWQVDMALEENLAWSVLAPYSIRDTDDIAARFDPPGFAGARAQSRAFAERYADAGAMLFWNSANEIEGDITDFIVSVLPVYRAYDPYQRPVHYANLFGQDRWQGQDAMAVNYYFHERETPASRYNNIHRSVALAREHGLPIFYTEYNGFMGAIHSTGVEAMKGFFDFGLRLGMAGGFFYFRFNSDRHPGVIDDGYNTHKLLDDAFLKSFADARVEIVKRDLNELRLRIANRRPFHLRAPRLELAVNGAPLPERRIEDLAPEEVREVVLRIPEHYAAEALELKGRLRFQTHHAFNETVPVTLHAP